MKKLILRPLKSEDATPLSRLIRSSPRNYYRFFSPFAFDPETLACLFDNAHRDQFMALELDEGHTVQLAGFYMLRGFDNGYDIPAYGVFIAPRFQNLGLARMTLVHAEALCALNGVEKLMLKVHPENVVAHQLYEAQGFSYVRIDPSNSNLVMEKRMRKWRE